MKHDNIVTVYAADSVDQTLYLVMELVHGESLADRLRAQTKLPWQDVLWIGREVTSALELAHGMGVVHRDITPANIMLEADTGRAKVMDFGLARSTVDMSLTATGVLTGTPEYMSPEQAAEGAIDVASDLFCLATVLYHACSGVSPFRSKTVLATLRRICEETPQPLHELDSSIPIWFSNAIQRLMEKDPQERPQSTTEAHRLFLNDSPTRNEDAKFAGMPTLAARTGRYVIVPLAVLGCLAATLGYFHRSWNSRIGDRNPIANDRLAAITTSIESLTKDEPSGARTFAEQGGFFVTSVGLAFAGLGDALDAAADNDSIEVRGDGPFFVDGFSLGAKRITIRAGSGAQPLFRNKHDGADRRADRPFISTTSDLKLEGIEVRWENSDRASNSLAERAARCIVSSVDGKIELSRCRLIAELDNGCVGCERGSVSLVDSHLVAPTGTCVIWIPDDGREIAANHCVFEGEQTAIEISGRASRRDSPSGRITLENNSFSVNVAFDLIIERPMRTFDVISRMNAFDTLALLRITSGKTAPKTLFANEIQKQIICSKLNWTESQNAYRVGTNYIKRGRAEDDRPNLIIEPSLNGWLATFKNQDTGSFDTEFHDRQALHDNRGSESEPFSRIRIASEMPSIQIGADLSRVGPRRGR
jgi:hypothetical protein